MLHSRSLPSFISTSEDRELMLFSAWLLACALLLEENYQQPSQLQAQTRKSRVCYLAAVSRTT
jgi:hypothetical protein